MVTRALTSIVLSVTLLLSACADTQAPQTTPESTDFTTDMPFKLDTPRFGAGIANDGEAIYVFGGSSEEKWLGDVEIIDPETENIQVLHDHILPRRYFSAVYDGNHHIYLIGGISHEGDDYAYESRVEVFDTRSRTISQAAPLPYPTRINAAAYLDGKIYVVGGGHRDWKTKQMKRSSLMAVYDIAANTWSLAPPMPSAKETTAVTYDGKIYVMGGYDGDKAVTSFEQYDPDTNAWTRLPDLPHPLSAHSATVWHDKLFTFGHYTNLTATLVYDFKAQQWQEADLPVAASRHNQATTIDDKVYVIGGLEPAVKVLDAIQVFDESQLEEAAR